MKLLLDEHLSDKLIPKLSDIFPGSKHVKELELQNEDDLKIWNYAKDHDFVIVTKDADFVDIVNVKGYPPYLVWIRSGNVRVNEIERVIRNNAVRISNTFDAQGEIGIVQIR
ncbi:MAG: DUF5615 family PIN-like protein [SAR324 cluster bacterium]|nr:DUF5615 family PIN-like protein [SAR324 cluster bacterium]